MKQRGWSYNFGLPAAAAEKMLAGANAQPGFNFSYIARWWG